MTTPTLAPVLVDVAAAAIAVGVTPQVVRQWHARGLLVQHGKDQRGRGRYDLAEVYRCAAERRRGYVTSRAMPSSSATASSPTLAASRSRSNARP